MYGNLQPFEGGVGVGVYFREMLFARNLVKHPGLHRKVMFLASTIMEVRVGPELGSFIKHFLLEI